MKFGISPYVYDVRLCLEVKPCWKAKRHNARLRAVRTLGGSTALTSTPHELNSNPGEKLWEAGSRFGVSVRAPAVTPGSHLGHPLGPAPPSAPNTRLVSVGLVIRETDTRWRAWTNWGRASEGTSLLVITALLSPGDTEQRYGDAAGHTETCSRLERCQYLSQELVLGRRVKEKITPATNHFSSHKTAIEADTAVLLQDQKLACVLRKMTCKFVSNILWPKYKHPQIAEGLFLNLGFF